MKKILIILGMLLPIITFAESKCEVKVDTSTGDVRNLTCDTSMQTVTMYKTKESTPITVLDNGVCKVTCTEEVIFAFDPIKKVVAGMGFTYPLHTSGTRKCSATYNYVEYEKNIRQLVNNYASASGTAKTTAKNEIVNYYDKKLKCDEFNKDESKNKNEYKYTGDVKLNVETSSKVETITYQFLEEENTTSNEDIDNVYYDSCDLNTSTYACNESDETIRGWKSTTTIIGKYAMPYSYVEKYTGKVSNTPNENTCNAKDRYFTDFKELSKPVYNNPTDNGYKLTLTAANIGNNLETTKKWNLNVNCWYQVKNYTFPQKDDDAYDELGSTGFMYRIIDVNNPFPDRSPNANWAGNENIILETKDKLSTLQKFIINLNRSNIRKIKQYNGTNPYDTFNLDEMEKSSFIENNNDVIDRK